MPPRAGGIPAAVASYFPPFQEQPARSRRVVATGQPIPKGGGRAVVGKPYVMFGRRFEPRVDPSYDRVGDASWAGAELHGRLTANGEVFDRNALTTAHPTLPLPSYVKVTNLANRRSLILRVNDRGPFVDGRIVDVSERAAIVLGFRHSGLARVRVEYLRPAPLNGDDSYEEHYARAYAGAAPSRPGPAYRRRQHLMPAVQVPGLRGDAQGPGRRTD